MSLNPPIQITVPFANGGLKNSIPAAANPVDGHAGYDLGFPSTNMIPKTAGGIPPFGQDFNGIFYDVTLALRFLESGGSFPYNSAFAIAIGGYQIGALVSRTDGSGLWRNTVADNSTNPETLGSGWQPEDAGVTSITMTNANVTLTALQGARSVIVISGALTTNLQLILPTYTKQWAVVNNCTGAFSITIKTAAGSGVYSSPGQSQAVIGDGTSILSSGGGRLLNIRVITVGGTLAKTPGANFGYGILVSGGGAGGGAPSTATGNTAAGLGGSAGGIAEFYLPMSTLDGQTLIIGTGGVGVSNSAGSSGGASTIGSLISVPGGTGGSAGVNTLPPWSLGESGNSSTPTGGNISNIPGPSGGSSTSSSTSFIVSGRGGSGRFGTGANARGQTRGNGTNGFGYGAGGSGAIEQSAGPGGLAGGNGTSGVLFLWEYT